MNGFQLACKIHDGQIRKNTGLPYIIHPLEVAKQLHIWGIQYTTNSFWDAVYLHDTQEDNLPIYDKYVIEMDCWEKVDKLVTELTFDPKICSKKEYMGSFVNKSVEALVIKLADRYCNINDFAYSDQKYAWKYLAKAKKLIMLIFGRQTEIVERFGLVFWNNMKDDYASLTVELGTV